MGAKFDGFLKSWAAARGRDPKRVGRRWKDFEKVRPKEAEHLEQEPRFVQALWFQLFDRMHKKPAWAEVIADFCHKHQKLGNPLPASDPPRWFGRAAWGEEWFGWARRGVVPVSGLAMTLDALLGMDLAGQQWMLSEAQLSQRLMWACYQKGYTHAPWRAVNTGRNPLLNRLGMPDKPGQRLIYWTHELPPGVIAHAPTALDAVDKEKWAPGGRTKPLNGSGIGLPEVVHDRIKGDWLRKPIRPAG